MNLILDTNILVHAIRETPLFNNISQKYLFDDSSINLIISVVSLGELYSIAIRNEWGVKKLNKIESLVKNIKVVQILENNELLYTYAQIDAFSQGKMQSLPLGRSAINMGKNDLWIATTATIFQGTLITTDKDFNHLDNVFLKVEYQDPA
jgi:tRNA(fMet)-specific endonuclease VapC